MLDPVEIPFGEFLPDRPDFKNPGLTRALNVMPRPGGYGPLRGNGETGGTATGTARGGRLFERSTGAVVVVGGGDDRLWIDVAGTVTQTTGLTSIGSDGYWQFIRFGQRIIACGPSNNLQQLTDIDTDTSWSAISDAPTQAEVIGIVGSRAIVGNLSSNPYAIEWSALNDPTTWTADATNYCGTAELDQQYGAVTGIAGYRSSVIFQERAVSQISRIGPPAAFNIREIETARGCIAPNSIAVVGDFVFFLAHDGFCVTNGASVQQIGSQRVNRYFLETVSEPDMFRTHAGIDWKNECVVWSYYPKQGTGFENLLIYSWTENRWSTGVLPIHWLVESAPGGTTLDALDTDYPDLDAMTVSLDSAQFQAGERRLAAYRANSTNTTLYTLEGDALTAIFDTGEFQPKPGSRVYANGIYPLIENASENTRAGLRTRSKKGGAQTASAPGTVNDAGYIPVRADGRYMNAYVIIPAGADWDNASGVQISMRASGKR